MLGRPEEALELGDLFAESFGGLGRIDLFVVFAARVAAAALLGLDLGPRELVMAGQILLLELGRPAVHEPQMQRLLTFFLVSWRDSVSRVLLAGRDLP